MLEQFETSQTSFVEASAAYVEANAELEEVAYQQSGLRVEIDAHQEEMVDTRDALIDRLVILYVSGSVLGGDVFFAAEGRREILAGQTFLWLATDADLDAVEQIGVLTDVSRELRL